MVGQIGSSPNITASEIPKLKKTARPPLHILQQFSRSPSCLLHLFAVQIGVKTWGKVAGYLASLVALAMLVGVAVGATNGPPSD